RHPFGERGRRHAGQWHRPVAVPRGSRRAAGEIPCLCRQRTDRRRMDGRRRNFPHPIHRESIMTRKQVYYFHSLSSPWAYLGWPQFKALIEKHDLDVVVRTTTVVQENGGVPLRSRPQARQDYHAIELDRWRERLGM